MDHKTKGLCFRYGKRFNPLYQCSEKALNMVIMGGEDEEVLALKLEREDGRKREIR